MTSVTDFEQRTIWTPERRVLTCSHSSLFTNYSRFVDKADHFESL